MSVLNDLIRIKTNKQEDDLLKMIDEIPVYEKLSVDEKLKDLKTSAITRAKCPMLAGFIDGNLYETLLADLVSNVYLQIEGHIPHILLSAAERSLKQQKQMEVLQKGIARIHYRDLIEYDHKIMKKLVAAVFTKQDQSVTTAAVIVKEPDGYTMYHGTYDSANKGNANMGMYKPLIVRGQSGVFTMNTYSVLGNNAYRFGSYMNDKFQYDVMIGLHNELYLMNGDITVSVHHIGWEDHNALNMAKKDPKAFAETITSIIESVV